MRRQIAIRHAAESSMFTPVQIRDRTLLALSMSSIWAWFNRYICSFRQMLTQYKTGMAVVAFDIRHKAVLGFFDCDEIEVVVTGVRLRARNTMFEFDYEFRGNTVTFATCTLLCRALEIGDSTSLAGAPGRIPDALVGQFQHEEIDISTPQRPVVRLLAKIEAAGVCLFERAAFFTVGRNMCEVADQWSYIEICAAAAEAREHLVLEDIHTRTLLGMLLRKPLSQISARINRPLFWRDEARILSRAYQYADYMVVRHDIFHRYLTEKPAATLLEWTDSEA
jgi:hypothetical protein